MNKKLLLAITFSLSFLAYDIMISQTKFWVMFKNKTGTPYSVSTPSAFLSPKSIARRVAQGISVNSTDLPVTPSYVTQVDGVSGVTVLYRSKWLNGVVVSIPSASTVTALAAINSFSFVQSTGAVNRYKLTFPLNEVVPLNNNQNKTQSTAAFNYGLAVGQVTMVGADCMHTYGYRGQGMTIAVLDAGFNNVNVDNIYDSLFLQNRLLGTRDFITGDTMVFEDHPHGAQCLSTMAGLSPGTIIGTAPKANYWLLRTEDAGSETISEEYNWVRGAEFADSVGADVCTTSLGYTTFDGGLNDHTYSQLNGKTAPMSIAATMASRKGMLVFNAAGNEGGCFPPGPGCWYYIGVPADADSIVSVGSVGTNGSYSSFSSHGPTADGRIKPDLCAQGGPAYVCHGGCGFGNGTSFATPVLAGAATCLWQYKKFATNFQIMAAMKASADSASNKTNRIGWGIPKMCTASNSTILTVASSFEKGNTIKVFPNPFDNSINISLGNTVKIQKANITIRNVLGQTVYSDIISDTTGTIQINEAARFNSGIYFVEINSPELKITKKIVKQ